MRNGEIEKRIAVLEAEVALLKNKVERKNKDNKPWYEVV
jgi:uncharacterized small protein (DUF1192 family)